MSCQLAGFVVEAARSPNLVTQVVKHGEKCIGLVGKFLNELVIVDNEPGFDPHRFGKGLVDTARKSSGNLLDAQRIAANRSATNPDPRSCGLGHGARLVKKALVPLGELIELFGVYAFAMKNDDVSKVDALTAYFIERLSNKHGAVAATRIGAAIQREERRGHFRSSEFSVHVGPEDKTSMGVLRGGRQTTGLKFDGGNVSQRSFDDRYLCFEKTHGANVASGWLLVQFLATLFGKKRSAERSHDLRIDRERGDFEIEDFFQSPN